MLSQVPLKSLHDKGFALKIYAENRWNFGLRPRLGFLYTEECPSCRLFCHAENRPKSAKPISGKPPEKPAEVRKSEINRILLL